jgi:hypothetical protein
MENQNSNQSNKLAMLVPTKSDVELAEDHKQAIVEASQSLMKAMSAAKRDGFITQINFGEDGFKNIIIHQFLLLKQF